jgi:hypothetical protein
VVKGLIRFVSQINLYLILIINGARSEPGRSRAARSADPISTCFGLFSHTQYYSFYQLSTIHRPIIGELSQARGGGKEEVLMHLGISQVNPGRRFIFDG